MCRKSSAIISNLLFVIIDTESVQLKLQDTLCSFLQNKIFTKCSLLGHIELPKVIKMTEKRKYMKCSEKFEIVTP